MKKLLVAVAVFLLVFQAKSAFCFGYEQEKKNPKIKEFTDSLEANKRNKKIIPAQPQETPQKKSEKKPQSDSSEQYSVDLNGHTIRSNKPIKVLPPSSGGSTTVTGNETVVRPNSSGGLQVVGGDVSATPNH